MDAEKILKEAKYVLKMLNGMRVAYNVKYHTMEAVRTIIKEAGGTEEDLKPEEDNYKGLKY